MDYLISSRILGIQGRIDARHQVGSCQQDWVTIRIYPVFATGFPCHAVLDLTAQRRMQARIRALVLMIKI